jgi:hypothetical protein
VATSPDLWALTRVMKICFNDLSLSAIFVGDVGSRAASQAWVMGWSRRREALVCVMTERVD